MKIFDELSAAFAPGGPCEHTTFLDLELLTECIFHQWMSVKAYNLAVMARLNDGLEKKFGHDGGQIPGMAQSHNSNTVPQVPDAVGEIEMADGGKDAAGDTNDESMDQNLDEVGWDAPCMLATTVAQPHADVTLANCILLMCDVAIYLELNHAICFGDSGRLMEVGKVS